jgi:DNA-directed RNA polymerase specialized sigma24 family protein
MRELEAQAALSAFRAGNDFDVAFGPSPDVFLYYHVLADLIRFYRKEWRYARRTAPLDAIEQPESSSPPPVPMKATDPFAENPGIERASCAELHAALARLPDASRKLIQQLFWEERKESDLAGQLGISHQAVSKRKQHTLRQLSEWLAENKSKKFHPPGCKPSRCCN